MNERIYDIIEQLDDPHIEEVFQQLQSPSTPKQRALRRMLELFFEQSDQPVRELLEEFE
ncbi:MAG: hypothetical protein ABEN55_03730 [Bradymonadaceae bacterium]